MVETILFILLIGAIIYFGFFWEDADEKEVKKAKKKEVDDFIKERKRQDKVRVVQSMSYLDRQPGYHPKYVAGDYPRKEKSVRRANDYSDDLPTIIPYIVGDDNTSDSGTHSTSSKDESSIHTVTLGGGHFGGGGSSGGWSYNDHGSSSHSSYSSHSDHSSYSDHSSSYDSGSSDSGSCDSGGGDCGGCD